MITASKMKPAKPSGKRKISAQAGKAAPESASAKTANDSLFEQRLDGLRQRYLGPPLGEPGNGGSLKIETSKCELSTKRAILEALPTEKLPAFESGFNELQEKLCALAKACHDECFGLATENRVDLGVFPVDFASSFTLETLSTFLRVTAFDGKEESREIDSNGRVRWFFRHACGDYSDEFPRSYGLQYLLARCAGESDFRLPQWSSVGWNGRALLAKRQGRGTGYTASPATDQLSIEETERFILHQERTLIKKLRDAVADARRDALIATPASKTGETAQSLQEPAAQGLPKVQNESGADRLEAIGRKITGRPEGWITNKEAALYYGCAPKTIRDWKDVGKLVHGPKRSSVSNKSILELKGKTAKTSSR